MSITKSFKAWAVVLKGREWGPAFAGRYYFPDRIPSHMEGCVTSLFKTRAKARQAVKGAYYPASPVRVNVTIEVVGK